MAGVASRGVRCLRERVRTRTTGGSWLVDHGCGAHSETLVSVEASRVPATPVIDEIGYDLVDASSVDPRPKTDDDSAAELGHS